MDNTKSKENVVKIIVTPHKCLVDEELCVVVTGLFTSQKVTLVCCVLEGGVTYFSFAFYTADDDGRVNVGKMAAEPGGSYEGIEPMGLIWSQKPDPNAKPGSRLVKFDVTTPIVTNVYVLSGLIGLHECLDSVTRGQWLCMTSCERWYLAEGVDRLMIRKGRLKGTLFIPKGAGPFPGVLDLFGTIGGLTEHRAALLASRGIASFALIYFTPGVGDGLITDMEYFEEAVDYLLDHPKVMKPYAGVIGVSQGAMLALLLSSLCHKIKACIEINGGPVVNLVDHSYKGEIFPCFNFDLSAIKRSDEGLFLAPIFENLMDQYTSEKPINIPLDRSNCSFLLIHGGADACIPAVVPDVITAQLDFSGKTDYKLLKYPGAGHLLEPPHSPLFYSTYYALYHNQVIWGGETRLHAKAQEHSWQQILNFFNSTLVEANNKFSHKITSSESKL